MNLRERSDIAIKCLPDAPYRAQLEKLHNEFLSALTGLHKIWIDMTNAEPWEDMDEPTIGGKCITPKMLDGMEDIFKAAGIEP